MDPGAPPRRRIGPAGSWRRGAARVPAPDPPLRAELLNGRQLADHALGLAAGHRLAAGRHACGLLGRLAVNERRLRAFNRTTLTVDPGRRITPAAEWLIDNFHLIEEQIQVARRHLPPGYSRELPRLAGGPSAGLPRVYSIALEMISHVDGQVDAGPLLDFVASYQTVAPLKLGELWAVPIMLRLGLIENLQRVTTRLALARADRDTADAWIGRLRDVAGRSPSQLVIVVADLAGSSPPLTSAFVSEFCQRLSRENPVLHMARAWLEQRLAEEGLSIEQLVQLESRDQATDQVTVSHSIGSLRFLGTMNWKDFVENLSVVERELRADPAGVYASMDFATRDRYRHAVEFIARNGGLEEGAVAGRAVGCAAACAASAGPGDRSAHVGFHLIDKGRAALGRQCGIRWPLRLAVERAIHRHPLAYYGGGILCLTLLFALAVLRRAAALPVAGWELALAAPLVLLCASQPAVTLVNWLSMLLVRPEMLPRMDFSRGIPPGSAAIVVIPTMLTRGGRGGGAPGDAGDPLPRQHGRPPALRAADGLPGRAAGDDAGGRGGPGPPGCRGPGAESEACRGPSGPLLPAPPSPALE